jgi:hypothetical protein
MLSTGLPVSRYVPVQISMTTPGIIAETVNTLLLVGSSDVIDTTERMRKYADISEVASDFGTVAPEYLAATLWFGQSPRPDNLNIGRWAKTATEGSLVGGILPPTEQDIALWTAVTTGGFHITIDGGTAANVGPLDFSGVTNLNGVATIIDTALTALTPEHAHCVWNGEQFVITSDSSGTTSSVGFLTAPTTGVDISAQLHGTQALAERSVPGIGPETALAAVTILDELFSSQWYGLVVPEAVDADHEQIAAYVEAADPPHYYGVTTQNTLVLSSTNNSDIAAVLNGFGYNKSAVQYSTSSPYAIMSYLGRILTTQWHGQNTTITLMYKQQPGVATEQLSTQQADTIKAKACNVYAAVANGAKVIEDGMSCSGEFTDTIIGADSLALDIQGALFNVMYETNTKVPQTDPGMALLTTAAAGVCAMYVANTFLAPGTWNAPGFGIISEGQLLPLGYYIYAPSMLLQDEADRAARKAPLMQVAAKTAGAIHNASVLIFVNQ